MEIIKNYLQELKKSTDSLSLDKIKSIAEVLSRAYRADKSVFIVGNGGSAATASHFACDLGKGTLKKHYDMKKKRFRVYSLTDNVSTITAYGNDLSYDDIFVQQLVNLINPGDVLIAITASGNSHNIIKAIELANRSKATTIGLLGFGGGKAAEMVDHSLIVDSYNYGVVEDLHLTLEHMICLQLKEIVESSDL